MGRSRLDDPAPFLLLHVGQRKPRGMESRVEIERDDEVPSVDRKLLDRGDVLHSGIVDEDIHTAKAFSRFRSEEHTSELQSLMRISYAVFCLKKNKTNRDKIYKNILIQTYTPLTLAAQ